MRIATSIIVLALTLTCSFLIVEFVYAQDVENIDWKRSYECIRAAGEINIDGIADEFAWSLAPQIDGFSRFQKDDFHIEKHRTTAKMLWDEENLYILVSCKDPDIWATIDRGDEVCLCLEETVEIFIDPDGDTINYAEYHFNSLGTVNELIIPNPSGKYDDGTLFNWDELFAWEHDGLSFELKNYGTLNDYEKTDYGTVFEISLPWDGFGEVGGEAALPPNPGDVWRINVNRYEREREDGGKPEETSDNTYLYGWSPLKLHSFHVPSRFGYVTFVDSY